MSTSFDISACESAESTGRVFTQDELKIMVDICPANQVRIISDEVHFLITYEDYKHIPILAVSEKAREIAIPGIQLQ